MVSLSCPSFWSIAMSNDAKKAFIVLGTESSLSCRAISQTEMDLRSEAEGS